MARHPAEVMEDLTATLAELGATDLGTIDDATVLADLLVSLLGAETQLQAITAEVAARVDASKVWANDGSRSCAAWLGRAANRDHAEAAGLVRRGRDLRDMPAAAAAHGEGRLSARHVRLLAMARRLAPEAFAVDEEWLVAQAGRVDFAEFQQLLAYWQQCAAPDEVEERARRRYEHRSVKLGAGLDGTGFLDVEFEPIGFAEFSEALRRIEQELWEADWAEARDRLGPDATTRDLARSAAQRRYDALIEMARRASSAPPGSVRPRPLVTVHVDHDTLMGRICQLSTGTVVTPGEVLPLLVDVDLERVVFDGPSRIIDLGRRRRFFTGGVRRAVEILHPTCTHPGCRVPSELCDIDHVPDWEQGGRTDHDAGVPRCPPHHPKRRQRSKARPRGARRVGSRDGPPSDEPWRRGPVAGRIDP
jgi:hypothetical protein